MRCHFIVIVFVLLSTGLNAQFLGNGTDGPLTVSGTFTAASADYSDLTATASSGATTITVSNASGFAVNDYIMIIQMIGTGVGNFEIRSIQALAGNTFTVFALTNTYTKSGSTSVAQAVKMRQYTNVSVTTGNTLTAPAWNGSTGGVLAFYSSGTVTVTGTGDVTMNGKGFSGGTPGTSGSGPDAGAVNTGGTNSTPAATGSPAKFATMKMGSGGGGGSAPAAGNAGANGFDGNNPGCAGGGGGFGGGGGAGSAASGSGGTGGTGGGIIYIVCDAITNNGSGGTIRANGNTGTNGGGNGGTGGTGGTGGQGGNAFVRTDVNYRGGAYPACGCFCPADNVYPNCPNICFFTAGSGGTGGAGGTGGTGSGGGGGGAGGVVFVGTNLNTGPSPSVTGGSSTTGGAGGGAGSGGGAGAGGNSADCSTCIVTANTCGNCSVGGSAGSAGGVGSAGAVGPNGTAGGTGRSSVNGGVPLPVTWLSFTGQDVGSVNKLNWVTASEINNHYFVLERSADQNTFTALHQISGAGNSSHPCSYSAVDEDPFVPVTYYRLVQIDHNGKDSYSNIIRIDRADRSDQLNIHPNPANKEVILEFYSDVTGIIPILVYFTDGRQVLTRPLSVMQGINQLQLDITALEVAPYQVLIEIDRKILIGMFIKE